MKTEKVYADHAASTPIDPEVLEFMLPYFNRGYGNPSSLHASGRRAAETISRAREIVATLIGAYPDEIIFTGSGTESDNLAIIGAARAYSLSGKHIVASVIEHKAVLAALHVLEKEGFDITLIPVDCFGRVDPAAVAAAVRDDTILVSIMFANNEVGTVLPVKEISEALKKRRLATGFPKIHTDACQAAGFLALDVRTLGVNLLTLNGSKIYGPKGIGMLYKERGTKLSPIAIGGSQEGGLRAGTESVPAIMGFSYALEKTYKLRQAESLRLAELRAYFISHLRELIPNIRINGHPEEVLPHIIHVTVPEVEGESMVLMLDQKGIEAATGSACSASDLQPSHVLLAMGQDTDLIHGSVRFSFGRDTDKKALDRILTAFPAIVDKLRASSFLTTTRYAHTQ